MKTLKKIAKIYGVILVVYWSIAGIMSLFSFGYDMAYASSKREILDDAKRRFLPQWWRCYRKAES